MIVGDFEEDLAIYSAPTETVTSIRWPVLFGAFLSAMSVAATFFDRSNGSPLPVSVGYMCGLSATVVAMYAASKERKQSTLSNYVRKGFDVLVAARAVRVVALFACLWNTYLIAEVVSR